MEERRSEKAVLQVASSQKLCLLPKLRGGLLINPRGSVWEAFLTTKPGQF